jgi:hypothetical protein
MKKVFAVFSITCLIVLLMGYSARATPILGFPDKARIDDTKGDGDTTYVWSADKVYDELALKQASDADLTAIAALTPTDSYLMVGNGTAWVTESGDTLRTSLGLTIGTDVQPDDVDLDDLAAGITGIVVGAGDDGGYAAATAGTDYDKPGTVPTAAQLYKAPIAFTANDETPDVSGGNHFYTQNDTSVKTITMFDGGTASQWIFVEIRDAYTKVDFSGGNLVGNHGVDVTFNNGEWLFAHFDGTNWECFVYHNALPVESISDDVTFHYESDTTAKLEFDLSNNTPATTATIRAPDDDTTILDDHSIQFTVTDPENLTSWAGRANASQPVWYNDTGISFTITKIYAIADEDDYTFVLFESNSATDLSDENDTQIDSVACSTDGTEAYTCTITSGFDHAVIEDGHCIIFEHSSGTAGGVHVFIEGDY